jgi:hypothetical protein
LMAALAIGGATATVGDAIAGGDDIDPQKSLSSSSFLEGGAGTCGARGGIGSLDGGLGGVGDLKMGLAAKSSNSSIRGVEWFGRVTNEADALGTRPSNDVYEESR